MKVRDNMNNDYEEKFDDDYKTYEEYNNKKGNKFFNENDRNYYDGEDNKPKLLIIIGAIILLIIVILIFTFACSKMNKKSDNNYLNSIRITNGELSPEFEKDTLSYSVSTTSDMVTIACSAESSKATTSGCNKNIYLTGECVEHVIGVTAQDKSKRQYILNVCKVDKDAPVIKSIDITPTGYTKDNVKVVITATSEKPLHKEAYSIDNGETWQESNTFTITENKTLEIKVRNENKVETVSVIKEIKTIDRTEPKIELKGSIDSGKETTSNVVLTALVTPTTTESGYKYEWYNENTKVSTTTTSTYTAKSSGTYKVIVITGAGNKATSNTHKVVMKSSGTPSVKNDLKITSVTGNVTEWTNKNVKLVVNATSSNGLASKAYSFDGGKTYQSSKEKEFSSNQTVTIVVKDSKNNTQTYKEYITKIDKTTPKVTVPSSGYVGDTIKATVTPTTTPSGYTYQWYKGSSLVSTAQSYTPNNAGEYYVVVGTKAGNNVTSSKVTISNKVNPTISLTSTVSNGSKITHAMVLTATVKNGTAKDKEYEWVIDGKTSTSCTTNICTISSAGTHNVKVRATTTTNQKTDYSNTYTFTIVSPTFKIESSVASGTPTNEDSITLNAKAINYFQTITDYKWFKDNVEISSCKGKMSCTVSDYGKYSAQANLPDGETIRTSDYEFRKISVFLVSSAGSNQVYPPVRLSALDNLRKIYSNVQYTWYRNGSVYNNCSSSEYCNVSETGNYSYTVGINGFTSKKSDEITVNINKNPYIKITALVKGKQVYIKDSTINDPVELVVEVTGLANITDLAFQYLPSDEANDKWYNAGNQKAWYSLEKNGKTAKATVIFYVARNDNAEAVLKGKIPFRVRAKDSAGGVTIVSYPFTMDFS